MGYNYVPLSKEDTYKLIERAKNGDEEAKEAIIKNNTGLVKNIAVKFTQRGYELDDLMQIGFIGLLKAAERFDFDICRAYDNGRNKALYKGRWQNKGEQAAKDGYSQYDPPAG